MILSRGCQGSRSTSTFGTTKRSDHLSSAARATSRCTAEGATSSSATLTGRELGAQQQHRFLHQGQGLPTTWTIPAACHVNVAFLNEEVPTGQYVWSICSSVPTTTTSLDQLPTSAMPSSPTHAPGHPSISSLTVT